MAIVSSKSTNSNTNAPVTSFFPQYTWPKVPFPIVSRRVTCVVGARIRRCADVDEKGEDGNTDDAANDNLVNDE